MNGITEHLNTENKNTYTENINIPLANLISFFHLFIILFVIFAPISNTPSILILHVTFCISLIIHWLANNNECSLTFFESKLRGLDKTDSFSYKFIAPIYDISKTEWSKICYIITFIVLCISLYKLYNSKRVAKAFQCYNDLKNDVNYNNLSFSDKIKKIFQCFTDLFIL